MITEPQGPVKVPPEEHIKLSLLRELQGLKATLRNEGHRRMVDDLMMKVDAMLEIEEVELGTKKLAIKEVERLVRKLERAQSPGTNRDIETLREVQKLLHALVRFELTGSFGDFGGGPGPSSSQGRIPNGDSASNTGPASELSLLRLADVMFSRPVPEVTPDLEPSTCPIGIFGGPSDEPLVHHWRLLSRGTGTQTTQIDVVAVSVADGQPGEITATITDENGVQSVTVPHPTTRGGISDTLPLAVGGGKIFDLMIENNPEVGVGQHYLLAWGPQMELGHAGPMHYLEDPPSLWAFHVSDGEIVEIVIAVDDADGIGDVPNQARNIGFAVAHPDQLDTPSVISEGEDPISPGSPIVITFTSEADQTLVLKVQGDGHYRMEKTSGSDRGFYALPCPAGEGPPREGPREEDLKRKIIDLLDSVGSGSDGSGSDGPLTIPLEELNQLGQSGTATLSPVGDQTEL